MTYKYSVQFERLGESADKLLCSAIKLSDQFCEMFPVSSATGYVNYMRAPEVKHLPNQSFWFVVTEAPDEVEAYQTAVLALASAKLEEPFPLTLPLIDDQTIREL